MLLFVGLVAATVLWPEQMLGVSQWYFAHLPQVMVAAAAIDGLVLLSMWAWARARRRDSDGAVYYDGGSRG